MFVKIGEKETYLMVINDKGKNDMTKISRLPKGLEYNVKYKLIEAENEDEDR